MNIQRSKIGGNDDEKRPCPSCHTDILISTKRMCPECGATLTDGWDQQQASRRAPILGTYGALLCGVLAILIIGALTSSSWLPIILPNLSSTAAATPTQSTGLSAPAATSIPSTGVAQANQPIPAWVQFNANIELRFGPSDKYAGTGIVISQNFVVVAKEKYENWLHVCVTKIDCSAPAGWVNMDNLKVDAGILANLPNADPASIAELPTATAEPTIAPTEVPTAVPTTAPTDTIVAAEPTSAPAAAEPTKTRPTARPKPAIPAAAAARYYTGHASNVGSEGRTILITIYTTSTDYTNLRACMQRGTDKQSFCAEPYLEDGVLKAKFTEDASQYAVFISNNGSSIQSQVIWVDTTTGTFYIDFGDGQKK